MTREQALPYVSFCLDDALSVRSINDMPDNARLVGWQCGFEPLFVAVWSYLPGVKVDADEAEEIARDYLAERNWFASKPAWFGGEPVPADYII